MKPWVAEETRRGLREAEDWRRERLRFHFELLERWRRLARGFLFLAGGEAIFLALTNLTNAAASVSFSSCAGAIGRTFAGSTSE
jgi:hypothetical protein